MQGEKYLVAADVIRTWPELTAVEPLGAELLVAEETLTNLETFAEFGLIASVGELVKEGVDRGTLRLVPRKVWSSYAEYLSQGRTSVDLLSDDTLARIAVREGATLVSDDPLQQKMAKRWKVSIISGADLLARVTAPPPSEKIAALINHTTRAVRREAILSFVVASVTVSTAAYLFETAPALVPTLRPWVIPVGILMAGVVLYAARVKLRLAYGVAEVIIGVLTGWNVATSNDAPLLLPLALQIFAAVYIIVRGLDNVVTGWPQSLLHGWWRRYLGPYRAA